MEKFLTWLEERAGYWKEESRRLAGSDRKDESDLAKVRMNVYGICKSVFQVLSEDQAAAKLLGLRGEWETSLSRAQEYDDGKKVVIEEIKLEVLAEIQSKLDEV